MNRTTSDLTADLMNLLHERNPRIEYDSDLTEIVLEDSLKFIELLVSIEKLRSASIPTEQIDLENFRTPRRICQLFLNHQNHEGQCVR